MHPEVKLFLDLQSLDQRILELEREVAQLPKHIAQIERTLESHIRRLEADRAALSGNQKERKAKDGDIQAQQQKISKLRDQMMSAKTNEQYRAFQNEIEYCEKEIRRAEDRILELMGESEPLDKAVKLAEEALNKEKAQVEKEKAEARERTAVDEKQLAEYKGQRQEALAQLSKPMAASYARIRKKWNSPITTADATEGRCTACHMMLRPQFFQELRQGDKLMFCESCGRLVYYLPATAVDEQVEARPMPIRRM
ncbi:MAG: C4-type zinc ribbon domain-containing protein [Bryobacteraceae bacterium]|nr:C4-type zinc ribbon domain-containing protein [Bryobacteraceae bacterium]